MSQEPASTVPASIVFFDVGDCPAQEFVPHLDEACRLAPFGLHLLRRRADAGAGELFESAWCFAGPGDPDAVRAVFAWMWARPDRWSVWGRAAVGLGPEFLSRLIERERASGLSDDVPTPDRDGWIADGAGARIDPERIDHDDFDDDDDDDEASIWCYPRDEGYGRTKTYRLFLRRGGGHAQPFFTLRYDRASERDRVWDWMQHQTGRYREFSDHFDRHGRDALKKLIYGGMLETERAVKKMGLGSGGTRPLRFWPGPYATDA